MLRGVPSLLIAWFTILLAGCTTDHAVVRTAYLGPVDDPLILPYRFVTDHTLARPGTTQHYPADLDLDGDLESYQIQTGRHVDSRLSSILFYNCACCEEVLEQYNFDDAHFGYFSTRLADLDADRSLELIAVCTSRDTVWIEILKPSIGSIYRRGVCTGQDLRPDGIWDGEGTPCGVADFTGDGRPEILIAIDVGYDLYPRKLVCLDWHENKILWEYSVAGMITHTQTHIVEDPGLNEKSVIFGVASKGNDAAANGMDDQHSYIVCLDASGRERWRRVTGGIFTNSQPVMADYNGDRRPDVVFVCVEDSLTAGGREAVARGTFSSLVVSDLSGVTLDSMPFPGRRRATALNTFQDRFHSRQFVAYRLSDDTLRLCDESLRPLFTVAASGGVELVAFDDFTGSGSGQFLLSTADGRFWLVDSDLQVLAQLGDSISVTDIRTIPPSKDQATAMVLCSTSKGGNDAIHIFRVARTPWYTVFSRRPLLAFVISFVPPSLVLILVSVAMVQRKKKNAVIARQRDELGAALAELKDMQVRLIEAEKTRLTRDIAGGVAHEIRNALDPAIHSLSLLRDKYTANAGASPEKLARLFDITERAIRRAVSMARSVRDFAGLEGPATIVDADVGKTLSDVIARDKERLDNVLVELEVHVPSHLGARVPRNHLEIILGSLVSNALDAMEETADRRLRIAAGTSDAMVRITVSDTGPGIPPEQRARIFNAFYSTKPDKGMGLGLTFAKRLAEVNGGSLTLLESAGPGACFCIELPAGQLPE